MKTALLILLFLPLLAYPQVIYKDMKIDHIEARKDTLLIKAKVIQFQSTDTGLITLKELTDKSQLKITIEIGYNLALLITLLGALLCIFSIYKSINGFGNNKKRSIGQTLN